MRIALAIAAAACVLAAPALAAPGFDLMSWSDLDHGWGSVGGTLYATSDGGRSWKQVFSGGPEVYRIQRTSVTAGIVVAGNPKPVTFWTRDGGLHWFRGTEAYATAVGHGDLLFTTSGTALVQVKPWPPRGGVRCHGPWWATAFGPGPNARAPKNVCSVPLTTSVQKSVVLTLTHGEFAPDTLAVVPGGVAGVATDGSARSRPLAVAVFRTGRGTETALPNAFGPDTAFAGLRLLVAWPDLHLQADAGASRVLWTSGDGGDTWVAR